MKSIEVLISIIIIGLVACTKYEGSAQYPDAHVYKAFIEKLDKSGVKYRIGKDQNVYFSTSDTKGIEEIENEINAKYYPGCGVGFTNNEDLNAMAVELKKQGIPFSVVELDQGPTITCAPEYREKLNLTLRSSGTAQKRAAP